MCGGGRTRTFKELSHFITYFHVTCFWVISINSFSFSGGLSWIISPTLSLRLLLPLPTVNRMPAMSANFTTPPIKRTLLSFDMCGWDFHPSFPPSLFSVASTKLMLLCFASTVHNTHPICVISDLLKQRCNHELGLLLAVLTKTHNLFLYLLILKNFIASLHSYSPSQKLGKYH